jgi:hypothetical protein
MLIRIFSPTECGLIRNADLKKCGLNRMTTVLKFLGCLNIYSISYTLLKFLGCLKI